MDIPIAITRYVNGDDITIVSFGIEGNGIISLMERESCLKAN